MKYALAILIENKPEPAGGFKYDSVADALRGVGPANKSRKMQGYEPVKVVIDENYTLICHVGGPHAYKSDHRKTTRKAAAIPARAAAAKRAVNRSAGSGSGGGRRKRRSAGGGTDGQVATRLAKQRRS